METWKPAVGYEGLYEISDLGRVKSLPKTVRAGVPGGWRTTKTRILSAAAGSHGYPMVTLCDSQGRIKHTVHSLVLRSFIGEPQRGEQACHGNGIRSDVRLCNLRWGTAMENSKDKLVHGTQAFGDKHWNTKISDASVERIREASLFGARGSELARAYGVSQATISEIVSGNQRV